MVDSHPLIIIAFAISTILTTIVSTASATPTPQPTTITNHTAVPTQQQLNNIIEAMVGAGDFSDWAGALSATDPSTFPITATLFVPTDQNPNLFVDPTVFARHTVPQRLTFADLRALPTHSRLPTLLPNRSLEITDNSTLGFSIESRRVTRPDVVVSGPFAVHGIESVFPREGFGDGLYEGESESESDSWSSVDEVGGGVSSGGGSEEKFLMRWFGFGIWGGVLGASVVLGF